MPKRLRPAFRFDRRLLGALPRLAWETVLEIHRVVLGRRDVTPGMIAAIHTFGTLLHWHPHLHCLVTDGGFTADGVFIGLPALATEPYEKLWQHKVFGLLLRAGRMDEPVVRQMLGWRHSGFSVHHGVRLAAGDTAGLERLGQYMLRSPLSLQRILRVTPQGKVVYHAEKRDCRRFPGPEGELLLPGVARNFQVFDALEFIAELTQHIPAPHTHLVRYFGWYSNKSRGLRARAADRSAGGTDAARSDPARSPTATVARRRWAALIKRVWHVDPLQCPQCGGTMKIIAFINPWRRDVIDGILEHCGRSPRAPPSDAAGLRRT